jgi:methylated-DNA-[protein]-cysteine S-methyltransferase
VIKPEPYIYNSPVGLLRIESDGDAVTAIEFADGQTETGTKPEGVIKQCAEELGAYFAGDLRNFTVNLHPEGTEFRKKVWEALSTVPYGETVSYGQLAATVGKPSASRAVGGANHHNPIVIMIPCHRVIGADGSLTGYGGGLWRKEYLLELERRNKKIIC